MGTPRTDLVEDRKRPEPKVTEDSKLLISEEPLCVLPSLAMALGLNEAIFVQQLHYWCRKSQHIHEGRRCVYNTYAGWKENFPFWSETTIQRIVLDLEKPFQPKDKDPRPARGPLILAYQEKDSIVKTKWYALNYTELKKLEDAIVRIRASMTSSWGHGSPQVGVMDHPNLRSCSFNTESTSETTSESGTRAEAKSEPNPSQTDRNGSGAQAPPPRVPPPPPPSDYDAELAARQRIWHVFFGGPLSAKEIYQVRLLQEDYPHLCAAQWETAATTARASYLRSDRCQDGEPIGIGWLRNEVRKCEARQWAAPAEKVTYQTAQERKRAAGRAAAERIATETFGDWGKP